ncbi:tetratricopeptide repeat protein [Vibrio aestuarianus]|uniref:Tetratricopeptide repeat protein n=1 Tax=Vibrio aestuarianus TaxID=28171 RepID=A0A9X4EU95_9VIBR|nr:tetratricopeptide repeat protein [Vibrio aestuarianus]MDE1242469.1 tetratricopeptide repeat protein [Vibrio aestuarianus]
MIKRLFISLPLFIVSLALNASELSPITAIKVQKAQQLAQQEKLIQAIDELRHLESSRSYDKAFIARMLGVFYWQNNQTQQAISQIKYAVESGELNDQQTWTTERMLADLYVNEGQFEQALPHYYQLVKNVPDSQSAPLLWLRISQTHYQLAQWRKVLKALDQYQNLAAMNSKTPLSLKLGAQLQLEQWKEAIPTLKNLIALEPNKSNWWLQLVGLHLRLDQRRQALNSLALAKLQGVELSEKDTHLLAQLYAQNGIPERAAKTMQTLPDINSDVLLITEQATYWQQAREWQRAIETWLIAAQFDNKYFWQVALLYNQQGQYNQALVALDKITTKEKQADVALVRVQALYKLNQLDTALYQAKQAAIIQPSQAAKGWIKFLTQLQQIKKDKSIQS